MGDAKCAFRYNLSSASLRRTWVVLEMVILMNGKEMDVFVNFSSDKQVSCRRFDVHTDGLQR
ncbi:hypothetical protein T05_13246 [Trichinella murrelli]|uniref:Uncharacterized protein n=1 Tax=Trichinella murrelli TaxID=144512 RepID=A0A0V0TWQ9_9BILA|nr:hypothetical protein T05_13246 [Trichinella murrelli]